MQLPWIINSPKASGYFPIEPMQCARERLSVAFLLVVFSLSVLRTYCSYQLIWSTWTAPQPRILVPLHSLHILPINLQFNTANTISLLLLLLLLLLLVSQNGLLLIYATIMGWYDYVADNKCTASNAYNCATELCVRVYVSVSVSLFAKWKLNNLQIKFNLAECA